MTRPTIARAARELQGAVNRLELLVRNRDRDRILEAVHGNAAKGRNASARLAANAGALEALTAEVAGLREGLGVLLDGILPEAPEPPPLDFLTEPKTKKRKKK